MPCDLSWPKSELNKKDEDSKLEPDASCVFILPPLTGCRERDNVKVGRVILDDLVAEDCNWWFVCLFVFVVGFFLLFFHRYLQD